MNLLDAIVNQRLFKIGRASNLVWIAFGERNVGEYALHLQCPWRFVDPTNSTTLVASGDIYEPNSKAEWSENFDWEPQGNNLFDEKIEVLFPQGTEIQVKNISVSASNDLKIVFSNNWVFECFINTSAKLECWRFMMHSDKKHLVATGANIEVQ